MSDGRDSLAGVWHRADGLVHLHVSGQPPVYAYDCRESGIVMEQGLIHTLPDGQYLSEGNGFYGHARVRFTRPQPDHLHGRAETASEVNNVAQMFGLGQLVEALTPTITFVRRMRPQPPPPRRPPPRKRPQEQRQARQAQSPVPDSRKREPINPVVAALTDHLVDRIRRDRGVDIESDPSALIRVQSAALQAIHELGLNDEVEVNLPSLTADGNGLVHYSTTLTSEDIEALFPQKNGKTDASKVRADAPPSPPSSTPEEDLSPLEELENMIGMEPVKEEIKRLDAWAWKQRRLAKNGRRSKQPTLHMCFSGPPGTGKTTVARIVGRLLQGYDLLETDSIKEVGRADLVAEFLGQTASKTKKVIKNATGGVLFVDEAYAISEPGKSVGNADYGAECLAVLIAEMENRRGELCVIVAGYDEEMERFLDANAGLASRIRRRIKFPDFSDDELVQIFERMLASEEMTCDPEILPALRDYVSRAKRTLPPRRWGNARSVRNILEAASENQSVRIHKTDATLEELLHLEVGDFSFFEDNEITVY